MTSRSDDISLYVPFRKEAGDLTRYLTGNRRDRTAWVVCFMGWRGTEA